MYTVVTSKTKKRFDNKYAAENWFYDKSAKNNRPMLLLNPFGLPITTAYEGNYCTITNE